VLGGGVAVAVANLEGYLGSHRQQLAARVAREVGRPIDFEELAVSLWGGPGVRVRGIRVAEDPEWGGGDLLRADEAWVTVRLLPALAGRFEIRRVMLRRPVLTVIRDQRGLNLPTPPLPPCPPRGSAGSAAPRTRVPSRRHAPPATGSRSWSDSRTCATGRCATSTAAVSPRSSWWRGRSRRPYRTSPSTGRTGSRCAPRSS